jgi:glycosyltransferase involved in cell wall biosynthesis
MRLRDAWRRSPSRTMPGKISVLFLHSQTGFGADSTIHSHLMRRLDRDRFTVHVAVSPGDVPNGSLALSRLREIPDVRVRPTQFAPGFHHRSGAEILRGVRSAALFPIDFARLVAYTKRERIAIVHGTDRPRDAVYAVLLGRLTGAKSVVHVHVAWSQGYSTAAKWAVRDADAVFAISRFVSETVVAMGTPASRVHTILNSVDTSRWPPDTDGMAVRHEFGIAPSAPVLASVSRLFGQKGQRELFRAFARVRGEYPDLRLIVVGADALEVHGGSFTEELKTLAAELDLGDSVIFAGERSDVVRVMAACDVFTLPSREEPFGLVFLEAMAMRKPVVALGDGGTPEVVEHGRSGLLSAFGDIEALAQNIITLLRDPGLRMQMGNYGRARVVDYFNTERMAEDTARAYDAVLRT